MRTAIRHGRPARAGRRAGERHRLWLAAASVALTIAVAFALPAHAASSGSPVAAPLAIDHPASATVTEGTTTAFPVTNSGTQPALVTASAVCGGQNAPQLIVTPASYSGVLPGTTEAFTLSVTPSAAPVGGRYDCTLTLTSVASGARTVEDVPVTVIILEGGALAFADTLSSAAGSPGQTVTLSVTLLNAGDMTIEAGELTSIAVGPFISATGQTLANPTVTVTPMPTSVSIAPGDSATFQIRVKIPAGASAGSYVADVVASGFSRTGALSASSRLAIAVGQTRRIEFSANPVRCDDGVCTVTIRLGAFASAVGRTTIYDLVGHRVRVFDVSFVDAAGNAYVGWDLRDADANVVSSGTYTVVFEPLSGVGAAVAKLVVIR